MEDLCRICRKRSPYNSVHIQSYHDGVSVSEMLTKTCPIDITNDDPISQLLPQSICNDCLEVTSAAFNLQRVCIESDQYFRSMIGSEQILVKNEKNEDEYAVKQEEIEVVTFADGWSSEEQLECEVPVTEKRRMSFNPRLTSEQLYECNFCLVQFKARQQAVRHMKQEHDPVNLPYGCDYCAARFKNESKKQLHEDIRHVGEASSIILCKICGINGISEQGMRNHMTDDHKVTANVKFHPRPFNKAARHEDVFYCCNFCQVKLKPKAKLLLHMQSKHDPVELPFYCNFCDFRSKDEAKVRQHQQQHNPQENPVFICNICTATGTREIGMEQHRIDDHGMDESRLQQADEFHPRPLPGSDLLEYEDTWYICNFCEKKIKPRMSMLRHMRKHSAVTYPFGCEFCIARYENLEELTEHIRNIHQESQVKVAIFCDLCGASGDNKEGMEHHILDDHFTVDRRRKKHASKSYKCNYCSAKFTKKYRLDIHKLTKHEEMTKCEKCDAEFYNKKDMNEHMMIIHSKMYRKLDPHEVEVSLKCCKCEQDHTTEQELIDHLNGHKGTFSYQKTKCQFCPKNLRNFNEFIEHAMYHAQPQTHECSTCKKKLPFDDKLMNHVKNHKRYDCYKVECEKCLQKFRSAKDLEVHDKVKHNKETLFICPICAKSLCSANGLDQHIRYVHNKDQEKKFQCKFCPMKFILKTKLTRHEAVHSTERPHVCEICGNSFKHTEGLALHMKRHNGTLEKKYECTQCSHKFTTKHRLGQHMMTHSGLKPHECKFCDRAYASKGDLTKHMQKLHLGDAIYQCEKCPRAFRLIVELREHQIEHGNQEQIA